MRATVGLRRPPRLEETGPKDLAGDRGKRIREFPSVMREVRFGRLVPVVRPACIFRRSFGVESPFREMILPIYFGESLLPFWRRQKCCPRQGHSVLGKCPECVEAF